LNLKIRQSNFGYQMNAVSIAAPKPLEICELDQQLAGEAIAAACAAPSADNNQPWKFKPDGCLIHVFCDLARRLPSDVDGMFDLLSLGAAIENMSLQLLTRGRTTSVSTSERSPQDSNKLRHVASIDFSQPSNQPVDELASFLQLRQTTRYPFSKKCLSSVQLDQIEAVSIRDSQIQLRWVQQRGMINSLASLVALSDSLRFRYQDFHEELHRQLRLSSQHADESRDGLDYRTLGLPPGAKWLLRALRPWSTMSRLNRLGLAKLLSLPSANLVRCSGAIGFLYVDDRSPQSMIAGGRAMQRIWLQATRLGLAIQPLGSLPIFLANKMLPKELQSLGQRLRGQAQALTPLPDSFLQMAFRIGYCHRRVPVRSLRREPQQVTL
jgi:hypothetical protein